MAIQFPCECGQELQVQDEHAGARVRCPKCQRECVVPVRVELVTADEPPPAPKASPVKVSRDDDDDAPPTRSRKRDEDDDEDDRPRRRTRSRRDEDDEDEDRFRRKVAQSSGMATASLILGLASLCLGAVTGIPALILGVIALVQISGSKGRLSGRGKAITGMTSGLIFSFLAVGLYGLAVYKVRDASARITDSNKLHMMAIAMHNYESNNNHLPGSVPRLGQAAPFAMPDPFGKPPVQKKGKPQLSWRVELLPYLDEQGLYSQFHMDEPWDSPANKRLIPLMPKVYAHPKADPQWAAAGMTVYRVFTGPHCAFQPGADKPIGLMRIVDGTSNTIMIAEAADPVIWTKPEELEYDANKPVPKLGEYFSGRYQIAVFDGSVRTISTSISDRTLRDAITIDDGNVLGPDW